MSSIIHDEWLTAVEAATYLKLSPQTLANKRANGTGPAYSAQCGIRYRRVDLDAWMAAGQTKSPTQARAKKAIEQHGNNLIKFASHQAKVATASRVSPGMEAKPVPASPLTLMTRFVWHDLPPSSQWWYRQKLLKLVDMIDAQLEEQQERQAS